MCDYSLAHFPNRLAVEAEQLIVCRFGSRTPGLAPAQVGLKQLLFGGSRLAVCDRDTAPVAEHFRVFATEP